MKNSHHPSGIGLEKNRMEGLEITIRSGETAKEDVRGIRAWETMLSWTLLYVLVLQGAGLQGKGRTTIWGKAQETAIINPSLPKISPVHVGSFGSQENLNLFSHS